MIKPIIVFSAIVFNLAAFSQPGKGFKVSEDSMIRKWTLATFCIEVEQERPKMAPFPINFTLDQVTHILDSVDATLVRNRGFGTAVFLEFHQRFYMITAKHVVCQDTVSNEILNKILLATNKDTNAIKAPLSGWALLKNYPNNPSSIKYILSKADDIAIIHLGMPPNFQTFLPGLNLYNYVPIHVSDIDTTFSLKVGDSIMAIGFPRESIYENTTFIPEYVKWLPTKVRIPMVTTGKVISTKGKKPFFEGDIFVYKGNSGGPILHKNKLVGIAHAISYTEYPVAKGSSKSYYRLFPLFTKSNSIFQLLIKLEKEVIDQEKTLNIK